MTVHRKVEFGIGIRADAIQAWISLHRAIAEQVEPLPCTADPETWCNPDDEDLAKYAAGLCRNRCPVLDECRTFADANNEKVGIWAGRDRTPRVGRPPQPKGKTA